MRDTLCYISNVIKESNSTMCVVYSELQEGMQSARAARCLGIATGMTAHLLIFLNLLYDNIKFTSTRAATWHEKFFKSKKVEKKDVVAKFLAANNLEQSKTYKFGAHTIKHSKLEHIADAYFIARVTEE